MCSFEEYQADVILFPLYLYSIRNALHPFIIAPTLPFVYCTASVTPLPHEFVYNRLDPSGLSRIYYTYTITLSSIITLPRITLRISRKRCNSNSPGIMTYGVPQPRMTSMDLRVGGKYRIGKKIGSGSFGMSIGLFRKIYAYTQVISTSESTLSLERRLPSS
jgi:hypothetical protein